MSLSKETIFKMLVKDLKEDYWWCSCNSCFFDFDKRSCQYIYNHFIRIRDYMLNFCDTKYDKNGYELACKLYRSIELEKTDLYDYVDFEGIAKYMIENKVCYALCVDTYNDIWVNISEI